MLFGLPKEAKPFTVNVENIEPILDSQRDVYFWNLSKQVKFAGSQDCFLFLVNRVVCFPLSLSCENSIVWSANHTYTHIYTRVCTHTHIYYHYIDTVLSEISRLVLFISLVPYLCSLCIWVCASVCVCILYICIHTYMYICRIIEEKQWVAPSITSEHLDHEM